MTKKTKKKKVTKKKKKRIKVHELKVEHEISDSEEIDYGKAMFMHFEKEFLDEFIEHPNQKKKSKKKPKT